MIWCENLFVHFSRRDYFKLEPQYSLVHQLVGFCDEQDIFKQLPLFNAVDKFINASEIISTTYSFSYRPFILKNMGVAIIDFRVCLPLVKCKNLMFSGFIDTLMYGFSSTGVTIYCYFCLNFNDNTCCEVICKQRYNDNDIMTTNKLPGMFFLLFF